MKKYVKSDSNFFDTVEVGDVIGNVNSQEELDAVNAVKSTLERHKLSDYVKHWRINVEFSQVYIVVYFGYNKYLHDSCYEARFNKSGECIDVWITIDGRKRLFPRFLELGQKLLKAIDGD